MRLCVKSRLAAVRCDERRFKLVARNSRSNLFYYSSQLTRGMSLTGDVRLYAKHEKISLKFSVSRKLQSNFPGHKRFEAANPNEVSFYTKPSHEVNLKW